MRTIRRQSYKLNDCKHKQLLDLVCSYSQEKDRWLLYLQRKDNFIFINNDRKIRDKFVKESYVSEFGLQARAWKMALKDACETMHKFWCSILDKIRLGIYKRFNDEQQRHYAYALIKTTSSSLYENLFKILKKIPIDLKNHTLDKIKKLEVVKYLMRKIKRLRVNYPRVHIKRSVCFDQEMYSIITKQKSQYAHISTKVKGKRIILPLIGCEGMGKSKHFGTIRITLEENQKIELHRSVILKNKKSKNVDNVIGVDMGYSEVFSTSDGNLLGLGFGDLLREYSDKNKIKNQRRNKLRSVLNKALKNKNTKKFRNILKFNLGIKKRTDRKRKQEITVKGLINQAINVLIKNGNVSVAMEDLTHQFSFKRGRNMNRRLSSWVKGVIRERIDFKSLALGVNVIKVNSAYTSQSCPICSYTVKENRMFDKFKCGSCGYENHSDIVGAINVKNRSFDEEIKLKMPALKVKDILNKRHLDYKNIFA